MARDRRKRAGSPAGSLPKGRQANPPVAPEVPERELVSPPGLNGRDHGSNDMGVVTLTNGDAAMAISRSQLPQALIKPKRCFVIMPSGNHNEYADGPRESDFVYKSIIFPAVSDAYENNIEIVREADANSPGAIDRRIVEQTAAADLAIVDITGQNPNVFFELGMRYVLRKSTTILLRQANTAIPFDITSYRCVLYDPKYDGAEAARRNIREAVSYAIQSGGDATDSLVYNVYPRLAINLNPDEMQPGHERDRMSWDDYWAKVNQIEGMLSGTVADGRYKPHALLGMSNGGMIVADLLGRRLFNGTPTASLWVNRLGDWFENPLNAAVVGALAGFAPKHGRMELLLVDDIVASGKTIKEAISYLAKHLPGASLRFLPLFSANEQYYSIIKDLMIWLHPAFEELVKNSRESVRSIHSTRYRKLPYDKDIRSS